MRERRRSISIKQRFVRIYTPVEFMEEAETVRRCDTSSHWPPQCCHWESDHRFGGSDQAIAKTMNSIRISTFLTPRRLITQLKILKESIAGFPLRLSAIADLRNCVHLLFRLVFRIFLIKVSQFGSRWHQRRSLNEEPQRRKNLGCGGVRTQENWGGDFHNRSHVHQVALALKSAQRIRMQSIFNAPVPLGATESSPVCTN